MTDPRNEFDEWFHGLEGFHLLSERFYSEVHEMRTLPAAQCASRMVQWLQAAFEAGQSSLQQRATVNLDK
jgi:hypothetical protein